MCAWDVQRLQQAPADVSAVRTVTRLNDASGLLRNTVITSER
jgi:hypothetical protein